MVCGVNGASRRSCRQKQRKTSFSPLFVFLLSRISGFLSDGFVLWHLWIGRARHPGPGSVPFHIEVLNVGGWLTHCDFALYERHEKMKKMMKKERKIKKFGFTRKILDDFLGVP